MSNDKKEFNQKKQPSLKTEHLNEILKKRAESLSKLEEIEDNENKAKFICFSLDEEWYGVELKYVLEILNIFNITSIPCTADLIKGVINLRGEIISITDLKIVFDLEKKRAKEESSEDNNLIIVNVDGLTTGLFVNEITDIADVSKDSIEPPLITIEKNKAEYLLGETMIDSRLHTLINLKSMMTSEELRFS